MPDRFRSSLSAREITPREIFFSRRRFLAGLGAAAALPTLALGESGEDRKLTPPLSRPGVFPTERNPKFEIPAAIDHSMTPRDVAASHNNFYEFLPGRGGPVWEHTGDFEVEPWKVEITGECAKPVTLDLDDLFAFAHEERVYHFRCVERWAMNVPWSGFPLSKLLERVEPKPTARYVRFIAANKPSQMPGIVQATNYSWPYFEALRMDEAMNELAMVVTGVYGEPLLKQHGAPVRIIVPWKYGYKNPKSIVKIELVRDEPETFWQVFPHEYGFLSNVNPYIPHPRWSQRESHWLEDQSRFETPIFNGYERYVADLYPDEPRKLQRPLRQGQKAR